MHHLDIDSTDDDITKDSMECYVNVHISIKN